MKATVKINEQGFESAEEYIQAELVPVVSKLRSIVSNLIEPSDSIEPKASHSSAEFTPFDKQVVEKRIEASYDWSSHKPIVNDKNVRVYAVAVAKKANSKGACLVRVIGSNESCSLSHVASGSSEDELWFQLNPSRGLVKYSPVSRGTKCIMYSFRIETVYA